MQGLIFRENSVFYVVFLTCIPCFKLLRLARGSRWQRVVRAGAMQEELCHVEYDFG